MAYWKQTRWDCYRLIAPGLCLDFRDYDKLYRYCLRHSINAMVV